MVEMHAYDMGIAVQCSLLFASAPVSVSIPLVNEIRRRSLNFIQSCFWNNSSFVYTVAKYGIVSGRYYRHALGHNVLFCVHIYNHSINNNPDVNINSSINN